MALRYLADTSAWTCARGDRAAAARIDQLVPSGEVATCSLSQLEFLVGAQSPKSYRELLDGARALPWVLIEEADLQVALGVQERLSAHFHHRKVKVVDLVVAAAAVRERLTVLHFDHDYELIAAITGQPHEWLVPPPTGAVNTGHFVVFEDQGGPFRLIGEEDAGNAEDAVAKVANATALPESGRRRMAVTVRRHWKVFEVDSAGNVSRV